MPSRRTLLAFLVGVALLGQPVVGDGPGADSRYTYRTTRIDLSNDEAVEAMYRLPAVTYGYGDQLRAVRAAVDETITRPESVADDLRALTDVRYLADDAGDRYYRVDARVADGEFRLDAERVTAAAVAEDLAVPRDAAPRTVRRALDGQTTASRRARATLVAGEDGYVLVRVVRTETVPDPFVLPKAVGYALGATLVVYAAIQWRHGDGRRRPPGA